MMFKKQLSFFITWALLSTSFAQSLITKTLVSDGNTREYAVYIPASYDGTAEFPLLFNFHGGGDLITSYMKTIDMRPIADTGNFILIYPQAAPDPTDGGSRNWLRKSPTTFDDVPFVQAMIDSIAAHYTIDSDRVYACGYSLGGELCYELACRLNNRIAAVAAVARTMGTAAFNNCAPVHPTGVLTILGTADFISPYNGYPNYYLSANETHNYWMKYTNCNSTPKVSPETDKNTSDGSTVERYSWSNAEGCTYVEHLKVIDGGHDWPGIYGNMDMDASEEIWNFVSRFDINGRIGCTALSTSNNRSQFNYTIYPNPFQDHFTIETYSSSIQEYKIYTMLGELILSGQLTADINTIDASSLPPNMYVLRTENQSLKLIKRE